MSRDLLVHKLDCIDEAAQNALEHMNALQERIRARARDLYWERGGTEGDPVDDWLRAEREVAWAPPEELQETDRAIHIRVSELPDATIDVTVLPECIILKGIRAEGLDSKVLCRQIVLPSQIHAESAVIRLDADFLTVSAAKVEPA